MLGLEAERAGHPAAAGVDLRDLRAGDAPQQRDRGGGARERLLVAVAVEDDRPAAHRRRGVQRQGAVVDRLDEQLLDELRLAGDRLRARVVREQLQVLLAQGQQARRLAAHDRHAALGLGREPRGHRPAPISRAWSSSPLEMLARPQQPALSSRTRWPAASSSSIAARPIAGSV